MMHLLTYDLNVNYSCVHMVFNLHCHLVLPGVAAFRLTDEDDAVAVRVADADVGGLYGRSVLQPHDLWPGFALRT